jgi:hypothetical protein
MRLLAGSGWLPGEREDFMTAVDGVEQALQSCGKIRYLDGFSR